MANVTVKDASGSTIYLSATGAGSDGDPSIIGHAITSVVTGTAATNLGKAEDAAHTSGDVGVMALGVANSTHTTTLSGTDGDYTPLAVDTTGKLGIRGTWAEDAAHTSGDLGLFVLSRRIDTAASSAGTSGDYAALNTDANGLLYVNLSSDTTLCKAEDAAHSSGDLGICALSRRIDTIASSAGTSGDYATLNTDANGRLWTRALDDGPAWTSSFGVTSAAFTSADASGAAAAVTDAPTSGQKIVITDLLVSVGTTMALTFTCETSGVVIAKVYMLANTTLPVQLRGKVKLATADKKLMVQASTSGAVAVTAVYYSEA